MIYVEEIEAKILKNNILKYLKKLFKFLLFY
jgi:hypothetical protein